MSLKEITLEQKIELLKFCDICRERQKAKCGKKCNYDYVECLCMKKKLAYQIAECEYKRRLKKGEIK